MERKIGEIFEYNGEWYQCVKGDICADCAFVKKYCKNSPLFKVIGNCNYRKDATSVIFNKLEKVGEPYVAYGKVRQQYKLHAPLTITNGIIDKDMSCDDVNLIVDIEIKQNKEDMEENKLNLKPFNLEAAKADGPVCTRDGRKARIICFDFRDADEICCIIAAVDYGEAEKIHYYDLYGKYRGGDSSKHDLMMLPEKKEGWVNVYHDCNGANITENDNIYSSEEEAIASAQTINKDGYVATTKITWEE